MEFTHYVDKVTGRGSAKDYDSLAEALAAHAKATGHKLTSRSWVREYDDGGLVKEHVRWDRFRQSVAA